MGLRATITLTAAVFLAYLGLGRVVPPIDDELYYWCWSKDPQWSYYDHPPMTAVMIRAATSVFGDTLSAVRLPACLAMAVVVGVLARLGGSRGAVLAALATPLFTFGAVIVTPDTPLLLFWALYLAWLVRVHRTLDAYREVPRWWWVVGGALLGCGILGKYTAGLLVPAGLLSFAVLGRMHVVRWRNGYALHLVTAAVAACPILVHNIQHDFEPIRFQWRHAMADTTPGLQSCGEFLGMQWLLVGTGPVLLLPWVLKRRRELLARPLTRACACLYAFPLLFFVWKSTRGDLQGNWAVASYLGFFPVAATWWRWEATTAFRRWHARATFGIPAGCVALLAIHLAHPLPFLPPKMDRITYMAAKNEMAAKTAKELAARAGGRPVFAVDYQWVSYLRFYGVDARQLAGASRPSHFTQRAERPADHPESLFFCDFEPSADRFAGVAERTRLADYEFRMRGQPVRLYHVWECRRAEGAEPPAPVAAAGTLLAIPPP